MINVINVDADLTTYVAVSKVAKEQRKGQLQGRCYWPKNISLDSAYQNKLSSQSQPSKTFQQLK